MAYLRFIAWDDEIALGIVRTGAATWQGHSVSGRIRRAQEKLKGLRHWLCSSRWLLRGSQRRGTGTVTAPDATTAFAVPNPNSLSRRLSVFSGLVARRVASSGWSLGLLRTGCGLGSQPFQPSTGVTLCLVQTIVNARLWCNCGKTPPPRFHCTAFR